MQTNASGMRLFPPQECGLVEALACSRTETVPQGPGVVCMRDLEDQPEGTHFMG